MGHVSLWEIGFEFEKECVCECEYVSISMCAYVQVCGIVGTCRSKDSPRIGSSPSTLF